MKEIPLTKGKFAIVDDEDFDELAKYRWRYHNEGYALRGNPTTYMHRIIMHAKKGQEIDHINGDKVDNRRVNLRFCTHSENLANQSKCQLHSSQFRGVDWYAPSQKWRATIRVVGHQIHIGYFTSEEAAARAYDRKAKEKFGEFVRLNFEE